MLMLNAIPHLKVYKQKVILTRDSKLQTHGSVILLNSKDHDNAIKFMKHPMMVTNSKFLAYYTDPLYSGKYGSKQMRLNYRSERKDIYEKVNSNFSNIRTPLMLDALMGRNVYYDISMQNKLFFTYTKTGAIKKRIELYFASIKNIITSSKLSSYKYKTLVIDVNEWDQTNIHNPITYIFLALKRFPEIFTSLGDIEIVFHTDTMLLRLNPSLCDVKTDAIALKRELSKLSKTINYDDEELDTEIKKESVKSEVADKITKKVFSSNKVETEDAPEEEKEVEIKAVDVDTENKIKDKIDDKLKAAIDKTEFNEEEAIDGELTNKVETELNEDEELVSFMHDTLQNKKVGRSSASIKRDEELRKRQRQIKIHNKTIDDYESMKTEDFKIPEKTVEKVATSNDNVKNVRFTNFEKSYNENLMKKDTINILTNLNDKSIPVYVKDIKIEDSSDELNYKDTYHVVLEDENRVRHNLTFDVPKFIDDKFLYINGSKKIIAKQLAMKPIVKTGQDEVQICSNYNKIFIRRYGAKISASVERLKKALATANLGISIVRGDASANNNHYKTILEYDEIAKSIISIKYSGIEFIFDQKEIENRLNGKSLKENEFCIGFFKDGTPICVDYKTEKINDMEIVDFIYNNLGDKFKEAYDASKSGTTRFMYSRATIMAKNVPTILLCGYCEGLTTTLNKANIKYRFSDKRPSLTDGESYIQFSDGYLVYDTYPIQNSLLMNGLSAIPTKSFEYADMDTKDPYIELFDILYNSRNLSNAFDSFYEFMIDPITKEVLEDLDYPTDFVSIILFANELLADNSYMLENNMNLYRIRSNEIINGVLHREIADAYGRYRATSDNKTPVKISLPKDIIIKRILEINTVEEFSTLNPIYESTKLRTISPMGFRGMNVKDAYTPDKRSYDKSMTGLLGISTSNDANVGIIRHLTMEPNVIGPRGYIDMEEDSKLKDVNLFTVAEMLTPLGVTRDDSIRTAMASKQSGHILPIAKASPVLISNGAEQTIQYSLSKDFVITAEEDGEVVESDEDTGLIIVKYKSGKVQAVDTRPKVVKNSSSGFYISNKMDSALQKGDKVKKNDIIGYENKFFTDDGHNGNRFNLGSLQKIAVMSAYSTYEDSTFITKKMSEDMGSEIVMMSDVVIGKNANVGHMVKVGDSVHVGDSLVTFETSYDDESLNKFLSSVGDELKEEIKTLGKVMHKSHYSGTIEDIKIYCSVDADELSPSLKSIVSKYYAGINKKKKILEKYDNTPGIVKAGILFNEPTGKIKPTADGKLKGRDVFEGVLIEFYIKYKDVVGVGDKIAFYSALKSIVGEVIEDGYEPYSLYRPDEEISAFLGPSAILARMAPSALLVMFGNKVIVELKYKLEDIYNS